MSRAIGKGLTLNGHSPNPKQYNNPLKTSMVNGTLMMEHSIFDGKISTPYLNFLELQYLHRKLFKLGRWI